MNHTRHYAEADKECPPLIPGSLRCYNMKYCPFAERTLLTLAYKNVTFDIVNINLKSKPAWFLARASLGKVPTLERAEGDTITESLVTMEYLEEVYPEPALFPKDSWRKAQDKVLVEVFGSKVIPIFYKIYFASIEDKKDLVASAVQCMSLFDEELGKRGTKFFSGTKPGYIDLAIWPWFERLAALGDTRIVTDQHSSLNQWMSAMRSVPSIQKVIISGEEHLGFMKTARDPQPNYDMTLKR